jgi:hypothetical protein
MYVDIKMELHLTLAGIPDERIMSYVCCTNYGKIVTKPKGRP